MATKENHLESFKTPIPQAAPQTNYKIISEGVGPGINFFFFKAGIKFLQAPQMILICSQGWEPLAKFIQKATVYRTLAECQAPNLITALQQL